MANLKLLTFSFLTVAVVSSLVWITNIGEVKSLESDQAPSAQSEKSSSKKENSNLPPSLTKITTALKPSSSDASSTLLPHERIRQLTNKSDFQQALVADHDQHRRYPPNTTRLESSQSNPIAQRYATDERTTIDQEDNAAFTVWTDSKYYGIEDTVNVFAKMSDAEGKILKPGYSAELLYGNASLMNFSLSETQASGVFSFELPLKDTLTESAKTGIYKILIRPNNRDLLDSVAFTLTQPDIELTGQYKDSITADGHLSVKMEVSVGAGNRFYVQASLYNVSGNPIGLTQFSGELSIGHHWIELIYPGVLLHDTQEDGPYILKEVSLAKVAMPLQRAPLQSPNFETQAYRLEAFSQTAYSGK